MRKNTPKSKAAKAVKRVKTERKPLNNEEAKVLHEMLQRSAELNHVLVNHSMDVENATVHLMGCQGMLAQTRAEIGKLHAAIAPLFHRLFTA